MESSNIERLTQLVKSAEERAQAAEEKTRAAEERAKSNDDRAQAAEKRALEAERLAEHEDDRLQAANGLVRIAQNLTETAERLVQAEGERAQRAEDRADKAVQEQGRAAEKAEEAQRQAAEAQKRAEEKVKEAEKQAAEAQKRAEEKVKEAEKQATKAQKQAKKKVKEAQKQATEAQKEAEEKVNEAQKQATEAQQHAKASAEAIQLTTLDEYVEACSSLVSSKFCIQRNKNFGTQGAVSGSTSKNCPTYLKPWSNFISAQQLAIASLRESSVAAKRIFESRHFLTALGQRISRRAVADEKALEHFMASSIEEPIMAILKALARDESFSTKFDVGRGIIFENYAHVISKVFDEESSSQDSSAASPRTPPENITLRPASHYGVINPDRFCVCIPTDRTTNKQSWAYISELKAPHKLTTHHLRAGLQVKKIFEDVVNRVTIPHPDDTAGLFKYHAERATAASITQAYDYMICAGLEYGLVSNGESTVFLNIDWAHPETLLYHLAEPEPEMREEFETTTRHWYSALGQHLAFTIIALGETGQRRLHDQQECSEVSANMKNWLVDPNDLLEKIPESARQASPDSPAYRPASFRDLRRSPYLLRKRKRGQGDDGNNESSRPSRRWPDDDSNGGSGSNSSGTQGGPAGDHQGSSSGSGSSGARDDSDSSSSQQESTYNSGDSRQLTGYCTQKCLLGLVKGTTLDSMCPNVALHRQKKSINDFSDHHPVSYQKWSQLLKKQIDELQYRGIEDLCISGTFTGLFAVTLLGYGYKFVGKGTPKSNADRFGNEACVYHRLEPIQGTFVPVYLGTIDLCKMGRDFPHRSGYTLGFMMFLSWAGDRLRVSDKAYLSLKDRGVKSLRAIHEQGVTWRTLSLNKMRYNSETDNVMVFGFSQSKVYRRPQWSFGYLESFEKLWVKRKKKAAEKSREFEYCKKISVKSFTNEMVEMPRLFWALEN
ncbi:hypothetical protein CFIMG_008104RA00001 [Ceratocystis fimbriata CBS 114723]|uniref:Uncharacterized protein n=1 Tax=Ceratocystis fimbriata CBS 114723 TaxID=1035309 RepID=A0A2C5X8B1_9PEZI|nr:hypothetical protein CFIMG_008104RA00001 [Ceratocystis fimbriata CBS 114723]